MECDCITRCIKPLHPALCLQSLELILTKYTRYADKFALSEGIAFLTRTRKENCHSSVSYISGSKMEALKK